MPTGESWQLIEMFDLWRRGIYPTAGGTYDQPQAIRQAMEIIDLRKKLIVAERLRAKGR